MTLVRKNHVTWLSVRLSDAHHKVLIQFESTIYDRRFTHFRFGQTSFSGTPNSNVKPTDLGGVAVSLWLGQIITLPIVTVFRVWLRSGAQTARLLRFVPATHAVLRPGHVRDTGRTNRQALLYSDNWRTSQGFDRLQAKEWILNQPSPLDRELIESNLIFVTSLENERGRGLKWRPNKGQWVRQAETTSQWL